MDCATEINTLGLIFDIFGAIGLFRFGLPRKNINKEGSGGFRQEQDDEGEKKLWKEYDHYSKISLGFLILGFSLQLISNYL